jgi:hypothetical protein
MSNAKRIETRRAENARRQREFRERRRLKIIALEAQKHEDAVLEDSIKLSANFGDPMAREIIERAPGLNSPALSQFFQSRAAMYKTARKPIRATKKNTAAKKDAAVFL